MVLAFYLLFLYFFIPAFLGFIAWFIETEKPTVSELLPVIVTTLFWAIGIILGCEALAGKLEHSKASYAVAAAAFTMSLTTYGELFNASKDDSDEAKQTKAKIKSRITVFRAFLIFVLTAVYFYK